MWCRALAAGHGAAPCTVASQAKIDQLFTLTQLIQGGMEQTKIAGIKGQRNVGGVAPVLLRFHSRHQRQFSRSQQHLCSASVTLRKLWNDTNEMISMRSFNREMEITGYN